MEPVELARIINEVSFSCINVFSRIIYFFEQFKYKKIIKKNKEIAGIFKGKTCYILGNGPSIKHLDLSQLKGKNIFVVNGFYESDLSKQIHPTAYCVYDKYEFAKRTDRLQELIDNKYSEYFFFSRRAIGLLKRDNRCYYIYSNILPTPRNNCYDLTKNANTFINVLGFCIMCALYMGFSRIVLLGNDFSRFTSPKQHHFYDMDQKIQRKESMFQELQGNAIAIKQHEYLAKYCSKHKIEVVNATKESLMDVYPIVELKDYLD